MKSNKARMNISRDMHEWFTAIDGNTNDERMQRVIEVNEDYKQLIIDHHHVNNELIHCYKQIDRSESDRIALQSNNRTIKGLLGLSMTVSIISVSYLAYVQGWFL